MSNRTKHYGISRFLLDLVLGVITGGIWWVYLIFKFIFKSS